MLLFLLLVIPALAAVAWPAGVLCALGPWPTFLPNNCSGPSNDPSPVPALGRRSSPVTPAEGAPELHFLVHNSSQAIQRLAFCLPVISAQLARWQVFLADS